MEIISKPHIIVSNPNKDNFNYFGWPTVTRCKDNRLAIVASGFRLLHICPFGKVTISFSDDEGLSWSKPEIILSTPLDNRDAGILVSEKFTMITSFTNTVAFQRRWANPNRDNDEIVGTPKYIDLINKKLDSITKEDEKRYYGSTYITLDNNFKNCSDIKIAPVTSPHGPCELDNGEILYVGRRYPDEEEIDKIDVYLFDINKGFTYLSTLEDSIDQFGILFAVEPHAICLGNGKVIVTIRVQRDANNPVFSVYQCESNDYGRHFTTPHPIMEDLAGSPPHLYKLKNNKILLTYASRKKEDAGIRARISVDHCRTYGKEIVITSQNKTIDLGYPSSVELENGNILTVYYEYDSGSAKIKEVIWKI